MTSEEQVQIPCVPALRAERENRHEVLQAVLKRVGTDVVHEGVAHGGAKVEVAAVVQDLDVDLVVVEDQADLDGVGGWALEVVAVTTSDVAVESRLGAGVAGGKNLEDVELTAPRLPAGALRLSVLESTWDLGVKEPESGHVDSVVDAGTRLTIVRHAELEEESLAWAIETVVGDRAVTIEATATVVRALAVGHNDNLGAGGKSAVLEGLWRRRAACTILAGVRKRVTEAVVESTGTRATLVVQKDKTVRGARLGVVVSLASPTAATNEAVIGRGRAGVGCG